MLLTAEKEFMRGRGETIRAKKEERKKNESVKNTTQIVQVRGVGDSRITFIEVLRTGEEKSRRRELIARASKKKGNTRLGGVDDAQ